MSELTRVHVHTLSDVVYRLEDQDYAQVKRFRDIERKAQLVLDKGGLSEEQAVLLREIATIAEAGRLDEKNDEHNHGLLAVIVAKLKELIA